ncbi:MAG: 50S ribosomal protein L11 methyltransferase [Gemmatimonadaceae bacterium]
MTWAALRILPSNNETGSRDAIVAALFASGVQAVVEDGSALVTHVPTSDLDHIQSALRGADAGATVTLDIVADLDWSIAWRSSVTAHRVGDLTIAPPWRADSLDPAKTIVIDPGMAFGTGDHASTRGVLQLLLKMRCADAVVADLGAGSAVLSIAAAKLGARSVYAIEIDADAIGNAEDNVRVNQVAERVHVLEGDAAALLTLVAPVDIVLANIISSVLEGLLPTIGASLAPGGRAILSGLLLSERTAFGEVLDARGWRTIDECSEGDWWTVAIAKN